MLISWVSFNRIIGGYLGVQVPVLRERGIVQRLLLLDWVFYFQSNFIVFVWPTLSYTHRVRCGLTVCRNASSAIPRCGWEFFNMGFCRCDGNLYAAKWVLVRPTLCLVSIRYFPAYLLVWAQVRSYGVWSFSFGALWTVPLDIVWLFILVFRLGRNSFIHS